MNQTSLHACAFRNRSGSESGQTLVEFAFVLVFWVVMVIAMLEMLVFLHTYNVLADAAKEGSRYAIVHGANNPQGLAPPCTAATCPDLLGPAAPNGTVPPTTALTGLKNFRSNVVARCERNNSDCYISRWSGGDLEQNSQPGASNCVVSVSTLLRLGLAHRNSQRSRRGKDYELNKCCR